MLVLFLLSPLGPSSQQPVREPLRPCPPYRWGSGGTRGSRSWPGQPATTRQARAQWTECVSNVRKASFPPGAQSPSETRLAAADWSFWKLSLPACRPLCSGLFISTLVPLKAFANFTFPGRLPEASSSQRRLPFLSRPSTLCFAAPGPAQELAGLTESSSCSGNSQPPHGSRARARPPR